MIPAFERGMMVLPSDYYRLPEPYGYRGPPPKPRFRARWPIAQWQKRFTESERGCAAYVQALPKPIAMPPTQDVQQSRFAPDPVSPFQGHDTKADGSYAQWPIKFLGE